MVSSLYFKSVEIDAALLQPSSFTSSSSHQTHERPYELRRRISLAYCPHFLANAFCFSVGFFVILLCSFSSPPSVWGRFFNYVHSGGQILEGRTVAYSAPASISRSLRILMMNCWVNRICEGVVPTPHSTGQALLVVTVPAMVLSVWTSPNNSPVAVF